MYYYRAKTDATDYLSGYSMIKGELFTPKERNSVVRYIEDYLFEAVKIGGREIARTEDGRRVQKWQKTITL